MTKTQIRSLIHDNIMTAIRFENKREEEPMQAKYAEIVHDLLVYLDNLLTEKGVRRFKESLETFDPVATWKGMYEYAFLTWAQEDKLRRCFDNFKTYVLK